MLLIFQVKDRLKMWLHDVIHKLNAVYLYSSESNSCLNMLEDVRGSQKVTDGSNTDKYGQYLQTIHPVDVEIF